MLTSVKNVTSTSNVKLRAYPNPSSNKISIDMPINGNDELTVKVYNYQGQLMQSRVVNVNGLQQTIDMDVNQLSAGNYIIQVTGEKHNGATKFVKID